MDCFVASAPRNDGAPDTTLRCRGVMRPDCAWKLPRHQREQGMPGARCTRGLVCKIVRKNAHEHTGSAETLRHPPRNGLTAYAALSPATNSSCHRRCRLDGGIESGRIDFATGSLTPATGAGTTRFCRTL